jgi:hypothetical protein
MKAPVARNEAVSSAEQPVSDHRCTSPWFAGLSCDHLFADCPNRMRAEKELRRAAWWSTGSEGRFGADIDPHGTDICGMCLYRHDRTMHKERG